MYPSDYGYATSGENNTNRETCLNTALYNWDGLSVSNCKNNDWLYTRSCQWTLTPNSSNSNNVFNVNSNGNGDSSMRTTEMTFPPPVLIMMSEYS